MSNFQKLYSYYFTELFRKNWIKIILLITITTLFTWFIFGFIGYKVIQGTVRGDNESEERVSENAWTESIKSYRNWNKLFLAEKEIKTSREHFLEKETQKWEKLTQAQQSGNQKEIDQAKEKIRGGVGEGMLNIFSDSFTPPCTNFEVNDFFLDIEDKTKGLGLWKTITNVSYWALGSGIIFSWLTLSLIDSLFLDPKKNGEDALVLSFTPGVKREDLLFSKISAFLTYFVLFGLVSFVLPCFAYYLWVGSIVSFSKLALLLAFVLIVAPLLIFGLLILPYLLLSSWSSVLGSLLPWVIYLLPRAWKMISGYAASTTLRSIENFFLHPITFATLALTVGISCFTFYYWKYSTEDLKG